MKTKNFGKHTYKEYDFPNFLEIQRRSYQWFWDKGLRELLDEISPVKDFSEKDFEISFLEYKLDEPKYTEFGARERNTSYESALRVRTSLKNKHTGEVKEQEVYLGDFPIMTKRGTFIVNGVERIVISQLIRSAGAFFTSTWYGGKQLFGGKIIPNRGAWLEFDTDSNGVLGVKIDRRRRMPVTTLFRALGVEKDEDVRKIFKKIDSDPSISYIEETLKRDPSKTRDEALIEVYKRVRPGDLATVDNAKQLIENMISNFERYDLSRVGRWKMEHRLEEQFQLKKAKENTDYSKEERVLRVDDILGVVYEIIRMNNNPEANPDDIDHLGNRRVRAVGELLQNRLRVGLTRMERIVKDKMSTLDPATITPSQLINARPVMAVVREFFTTGQLSQFMDNTNPLSELEHKRRLSATGPGGLTRERAGFEVRDVQPSHYGRICPIQTPEGPNIGLVGHLASYALLNEYGFLETPYFKVKDGRITGEIEYLNAHQEERMNIASADVQVVDGKITEKFARARIKGTPGLIEKSKIQYVDVSSQQAISVATALIPFLEHDDANRALMGSNMQRQAVPCIKPQAPYVRTGLEERVARDSGLVMLAEEDGDVLEADASHIKIRVKNPKGGGKIKSKATVDYRLTNFRRSNQYTAIHQKTLVKPGDRIRKGDVIADGSAVEKGVLALGRNVLTAFVSWRGNNFEDAVVVSEKLVREDAFSSIHIEDFSIDVRETKLGPEVTTCDIPNVSEEKLRDLDEEGIIRIGAYVEAGDILVGKISPKGESDLTSEERLLRAIFGEKARDIKDTSLSLPHGKRGRIVGVNIFLRDSGDKLPPGVIKSIQIEVAQLRKIGAGDKIAGRHGNKGVIARVLPEEDMPYLPDGTPVDLVIDPLGVPSRMNIGQVLETHLGWAAGTLGYQALTPALSGATEEEIKQELQSAGLAEDGRTVLYDGYTGLPFANRVTVGYMYVMKLIHMVEDKIHMRAIGPYSLITQQPLSGKAQFGGQRFGEMEVWALEGYGAAHTLQEILTIKSDDVMGRASAYESIIKGEPIKKPNVPESFNVLISELKSLGLNVEVKENKSSESE
ncbi:MAG: DNA-directed RNA polymerase subunit beta [Candidatus Spechtbacteria bacterium RIFCSPHIGHO2_02_FULL_43_15b]|uniref:DNA-directed RNA polymerase subunit beta n=1 Tax=Candidatus Spechtbacteria bacterium RIFCSPHIGHO2_01_FULL_43_30 TaxID=1802158 RepID=A0A1G2H7N3_9BACT|nr:MAG: DNA-directed RNA polymerase subunit beta [Candidatus Spechtbacteria bacterium RIFCSPHIGHO2_01_FULL_43_30]OGZ60431.1 MAG: DNA-directed RNA polymerase subunit beta [Candidatus Spechtbacteria bacterium RIFCSPHIGHO2_02_FULL_43_15b]